jgi:hypothetical protein
MQQDKRVRRVLYLSRFGEYISRSVRPVVMLKASPVGRTSAALSYLEDIITGTMVEMLKEQQKVNRLLLKSAESDVTGGVKELELP